jgi:hypothetical protein
MSDHINDGQPFIGSQSHAVGISQARLKTLLATRQVRRVLRGVYVDTRAPDDRILRAAALQLVKPEGAVFYGTTVAFLLGLDVFPPLERFNFTPQCVVPHGTSRCRQPLVRCREGYLPERDLERVEGLIVTTAVRTAVDLLRTLRRPHALAADDAMAHAGLVTPDELRAYIKPMRHYPGIVQARSLAPLIDCRVESPGESWQRLRLYDAGFPIPRPQLVVEDRAGFFVARLDNVYESAKIGMEYDGREFHSDEVAETEDERKRSNLRDNLGWRLAITRREDIFGDNPAFEQKVGEWLGLVPRLPRRW